MCDHAIYIFEELQNSIEVVIGAVFVLAGIVQDKRVSMCIHGEKTVKVVTNVCNAKRAEIPFKYQRLLIKISGDNGKFCSAERTSCDYEAGKQSTLLQKCLHQSQSTTPQPALNKFETTPYVE